MNDPHVEQLIYELVLLDRGAVFNRPAPVRYSEPSFDIELADDRATIRMNDHYEHHSDAREAVEPVLRAWEASALLEGRRIEFRFADARTTDGNPLAGSENGIWLSEQVVTAKMHASGTDEHLIASYPAPPVNFQLDQHTDVLMLRYRRFREGQVSFIECAAFTSSYIDKLVGGQGRKGAATYLRVEPAILDKLGELTSAVGDLETVRKIDRGWQNRPHTSKEIAWMQAAVPLLIRRISELGARPGGAPPQRLTMADLPQL